MRSHIRLRPAVCLLSLLLLALPGIATAQDTDQETSQNEPAPDQPPPSTTRSNSGYTKAQNIDQVRPFLLWIEDALISTGVDLQPAFILGDGFGGSSSTALDIQAQGAFWTAENLELGGRWAFRYVDFSGGSESGMTDLRVYGRYRIEPAGPQIALGGFVDIPLGKTDVGANNFDFEFFGSVRHLFDDNWEIVGSAGIESSEWSGSRTVGVMLGAALLYPFSPRFSGVFELDVRTSSDLGSVSGGVDFRTSTGGRLRGAISLGIDDRAPDFGLQLAFLIPL